MCSLFFHSPRCPVDLAFSSAVHSRHLVFNVFNSLILVCELWLGILSPHPNPLKELTDRNEAVEKWRDQEEGEDHWQQLKMVNRQDNGEDEKTKSTQR